MGKKHGKAKGELVTGIAWYRPEQWQRLREVSADGQELEQTHAEWLAVATKTLTDLEREGFSVRKVDVDLEELLTWCGQKGMPVDGRARASFAQHKLHHLKETEQSS